MRPARQGVDGRPPEGGDDEQGESADHEAVDRVKRALGERGPVWWDDSTPDLNRHMALATAYADWYRNLGE